MKGFIPFISCFAAALAMAADRPLVVVPFAGVQVMVDKTIVDIQGTWATTAIEGNYAKKTYDPGATNSVYIACYRKEKSCYEALGWVDDDGYLRELLIPYDVTKWTDGEIKAESNDLCETTELIIVAGGKEITKTIRTGGLTPQRGCPDRTEKLLSPVVMKLMEPRAAAKYLRDKKQ
jgi:hypothetical protein